MSTLEASCVQGPRIRVYQKYSCVGKDQKDLWGKSNSCKLADIILFQARGKRGGVHMLGLNISYKLLCVMLVTPRPYHGSQPEQRLSSDFNYFSFNST